MRQPLLVLTGSIVLYSKYAGGEFKGSDGTNYIVLKASDVIVELVYFSFKLTIDASTSGKVAMWQSPICGDATSDYYRII
jgi:hypothetical protein